MRSYFRTNRAFTEKALLTLTLIQMNPEGIGAYLQCMFDVAKFSIEPDSSFQNPLGIVYLNTAMSAIDDFEKTGKEALSEEEIFGGKSPASRPTGSKWIHQQRCRFSAKIFHIHASSLNGEMMKKLVIPAIEGILRSEKALKYFLEARDFRSEQFVPVLWAHVGCLIMTRHYAQLDHILSILMFHLVKNGRSVRSTEEQTAIDAAKGMVCFFYTDWAHNILRYSRMVVLSPENSDVVSNPIKTEMVRYEEYVEPGVEKYENQFPVDAVESGKECKKVIKTGKIWGQRAIDYMQKGKGTPHKFLQQEENAKILMKRLDQWEQEPFF